MLQNLFKKNRRAQAVPACPPNQSIAIKVKHKARNPINAPTGSENNAINFVVFYQLLNKQFQACSLTEHLLERNLHQLSIEHVRTPEQCRDISTKNCGLGLGSLLNPTHCCGNHIWILGVLWLGCPSVDFSWRIFVRGLGLGQRVPRVARGVSDRCRSQASQQGVVPVLCTSPTTPFPSFLLIKQSFPLFVAFVFRSIKNRSI